MKEKILRGMARVAHKEAEKNANSLCLYWHHQPEVPAEVKKLRKF